MGFLGASNEFGPVRGLYGQIITSDYEERRLRNEFEDIFLRVREALSGAMVTVLTHMPKRGWSMGEYVDGWIYVSGHTHENRYRNFGRINE